MNGWVICLVVTDLWGWQYLSQTMVHPLNMLFSPGGPMRQEELESMLAAAPGWIFLTMSATLIATLVTIFFTAVLGGRWLRCFYIFNFIYLDVFDDLTTHLYTGGADSLTLNRKESTMFGSELAHLHPPGRQYFSSSTSLFSSLPFPLFLPFTFPLSLSPPHLWRFLPR